MKLRSSFLVLAISVSFTSAVAGCSSGSSSTGAIPSAAAATVSGVAAATTSTSTAAVPAADTAAQTAVSGAVAAGPDLAAKGCSSIKISDAQPLVKASVTKIDFDPGSAELRPDHEFQCGISEQAVTVSVSPQDSSKAVYATEVQEQNVVAHPLSGIGESAVWAGVEMMSVITAAPTLIAHKGSVTCVVQAPSGSVLTLPLQTGPPGGSTVSDTIAYAKKMGAVCNDIFATLG